MTDKKMTLVERLRNPAWESDGHATVLAIEQTRKAMDDAAAEIESLQEALDDALNPNAKRGY